MAQNSEAIFKLGLEVIGADAIKQAAAALRQLGAETKAIQPARIETIIGAIDLATPVYAKVARGIKGLGDTVVAETARIIKSLEAQRAAYRIYAEEMGRLGVSNRLLRPVQGQVFGQTTRALGLTPDEAQSIQRSNQLYGQLGTAFNSIDQSGASDEVVAERGQLRALRATRAVAYLAPQVLGGGIRRNPDYRVIVREARIGDVRAAQLQGALAQLAPLVAQRRYLEASTAAFRNVGERRLITATGSSRQGFEPLYELESRYRSDPLVTERLQSALAIGDEPAEEDLRTGAFLLAQRKRLVGQSIGLPKRRLSPLEIAQLLRIRTFGRTEDDPMQYLFTTGDVTSRSEAQRAGGGVGPGQFLTAEQTVYGGRYLDFMPQPTTYVGGNYRGLRPRTKDVRRIPAGPLQEPPINFGQILPPTAIETTFRVVPPSEGQQGLISAAEAAVTQGRGMIPEETIEERFRRINYQRGLEALQRRAAEKAAKAGLPIPSGLQLPEEGESTRLNREEAEAEAQASRRRRRSRFNLGESGMARVGRAYGSIGKEAEALLEDFPRSTIFPKTLGEKLNIDPSATASLIRSLQERGFLGEAEGTGLKSALPIIGARARRSSQINQETIENNLAKETEQLEQERRNAKNALIKATRVVENGGPSPGTGGVFGRASSWTRGTFRDFGGGSFGGGGFWGGFFGGQTPEPGPGPGGGGGGGGLFTTNRFASRFAGLTNFVGAAAILYPLVSTIFSSVQASIQLEANVKRIQAIYGSHTLGDQLTIRSEIVKAARDVGENVNEVAAAAQQFAQAQTPIADLPKNLQAATIGAKAFGSNIKEIADYIIAVNATTGGKVTGMQAVDILASISRRTPVSPQNLMAAIQNIGPSLEPFAPTKGNIDNQSLIGAITGVEATQGRVTGAQTGAALRFLIGRLGNPAGVARIQDLTGVNLATTESRGTELRPFVEILNDLSVAYERLLKQGRSGEAQDLLRELFGARQVTTGTILLTHFKDVLDLVTGGLNDQGAAAKMASEQTTTLQSSITNLKTSLTDLFSGYSESGTKAVNILTKFVELLQKPLPSLSEEQKPAIFKWMEHLFEGAPGSLVNKLFPPIGNTEQPYKFSPEKMLGNYSGPVSEAALPDVPGADILNYLGLPIPPAAKLKATVSAPDRGVKLFGDPAQFDAAFRKLKDSTKGQDLIFNQLGIDIDKTKNRLNELKQAFIIFFSTMNTAQQGDRASQFRELLRLFNETNTRANQEALREQSIRNQATISTAQDSGSRSALRIQLRGELSRRTGLDHPEAVETAFRLIDLETQQEKVQSRMNFMADFALTNEEQKLELLGADYLKNLELLDIKNQQQKVDFVLNKQLEDRVRLERRQKEETGAIIGGAFKGLLDLPKALERNRTFGAGVQAVFGPVAGALSSNRARDITDIFANANFGGKLSGTGKIDQQIQQAQEAYNKVAITQAKTGAVSTGELEGLGAKVAELKKVKAKQILEQQAAQFGGELITSITGGNTQNSQIGGEIGGAVGNLVAPGIGGIIGAGLGSLVGGLFGKHHPTPQNSQLQIIADNSREQVRLLENTNKLLEVNFISFNVPTGFRLPSYQPGSFGGITASRGGGGGVVNSSIHVAVNIGGTNVSAEKLGATVAQAISDRLELESRSAGGYNPRLLYG